MASLDIKGDSFAGRYKRVNDYPIDSTDTWDTLAHATQYAQNADDTAYVPYNGQIITCLENGQTYRLEPDADITAYPERNHYKLVPVGSNTNNDERYVRRDIEEKITKLMTFLAGISVTGGVTADVVKVLGSILSGGYAAGASGWGVTGNDGIYTLDIDNVQIRRTLRVDKLQINSAHYTAGVQYNTCGGMVCTEASNTGTAYRCKFKRTDAEGRTVYNTFEVGDMAKCQTWKELDNKYYWRLVTAVGDDYVDLSIEDCDNGSGVPAAGDEIVQLGNRTDTTRQGAETLDTVTQGGPYINVYRGINSYTMPEPLISLNPTKSTIRAKLINASTGTTMDDIESRMEIIQQQTDKEYTLWFYDYEPSASSAPESEWTTDEMKATHEEDIFYNRKSGKAYRYTKSDSGYTWAPITDADTLRALELASHAQETADSKRRVFVSQPTAADAYDVGDQWTNATYPVGTGIYSIGGVTYTAASPLYKNDALVCIVAKAAGAAFDIADWKAVSTATTAVISNLGERITLAVTDARSGIDSAHTLAQQGVDDAAAAAAAAQAAQSTANTNKGLIDSNTSAIEVNKNAITAVSNKVTTNASGLITNIDTSALVLTADFDSLLAKKVTLGTDGLITNIDKSGLVTTANFAEMFASQQDTNGLVKKAYIDTYIVDEKDADGNVTGHHLANVAIGGDNVTIDAECINFAGKTIINNHFVVGTDGALTLDSITAKDITLSGTISGANAVLDSVTAKDITLSGTISGANAVLDSITAKDITLSGTISGANAVLDSITVKDIKFSGTMAGGDATINDITINGKIHCQSLVETIVDKTSVDGFDVDPTEGHTFLVSLQPSTLSETYITLPSASSYPGLKLSFDVGPMTTRSAIRTRRLYSANSELIYSSNSVQDAGYKYYAMPSCRTELVSSFGKWVVLNYSANANFTNS